MKLVLKLVQNLLSIWTPIQILIIIFLKPGTFKRKATKFCWKVDCLYHTSTHFFFTKKNLYLLYIHLTTFIGWN